MLDFFVVWYSIFKASSVLMNNHSKNVVVNIQNYIHAFADFFCGHSLFLRIVYIIFCYVYSHLHANGEENIQHHQCKICNRAFNIPEVSVS